MQLNNASPLVSFYFHPSESCPPPILLCLPDTHASWQNFAAEDSARHPLSITQHMLYACTLVSGTVCMHQYLVLEESLPEPVVLRHDSGLTRCYVLLNTPFLKQFLSGSISTHLNMLTY